MILKATKKQWKHSAVQAYTSIAILQACGLEEATVSFTDAFGEHYEVVIRRTDSAADEEDDT